MIKKYIVELTDEERLTHNAIVKKLKGSSQKVKRANILLKADALGPGWTDAKIAEALDCAHGTHSTFTRTQGNPPDASCKSAQQGSSKVEQIRSDVASAAGHSRYNADRSPSISAGHCCEHAS